MHVVNKQGLGKRVLAASIAAMLGVVASPVLADDEALLDKLYEKGYLTEDEYKELGGGGESESASASSSSSAKSDDGNAIVAKFKDGGPRWESKDGQHGILLHGRVQFDYRSSDLPDSTDQFQLRRAYLGVKGKLYDKWTYEATYDLDRSRAEYAYINYKFNNAVQLRGGLFKFPYGFAQLTSSRFTDFMERSLTDDFEPGKDEGVMVYGQPKKNVFSYALGYSNGGNGRQTGADTDAKDLIGRAAVNFAPMINFDKGVLHLGGDYRGGEFNVAGTDFDRSATGVELVGAYGPVRLQGEAQSIDLSTDTAANPDVDVYYVNAMWMITGEKYVDNYSINGMKAIKPLKPLHAGGMGAWELGVQFAELDADQDNSGQNNLESMTFGLKWIPETNVRILLNVVENKFETPITVSGQPVSKETQVNGRVQLHF